MKLSVIIVSYNVKKLLEQCLYSVQKAITGMDAEIIVIDNHSADGSGEYLTPLFKEVKFVFNNENTGFAKACNQGSGISSGEYILFLNPDTEVPENSFRECISFLGSHPEAGAAGVRMVDTKGKFLRESKRGFPAPAASFCKLFGLAKLFPESKTFARYYLGHLKEKENNPAEILSGAFMMIKRNVLQRVSGFDETFFMYGEDIDLSWRIQQAGFVNYYLGSTTIIHHKGKSTRYNRDYLKNFYGAMNIFIKKHYAGKKPAAFTWLLYAGVWLRKMIAAAGLLFR